MTSPITNQPVLPNVQSNIEMGNYHNAFQNLMMRMTAPTPEELPALYHHTQTLIAHLPKS